MTRLGAASTHLAISAFVGAILFVLFRVIWYPPPLLQCVGGDHIFLILLAVDIVLGPLLTLIVFDTKKKSLRLDLTILALAQAAALAYGAFTLLSGRPVYVAALGHRFDVVQANEIDRAELASSGRSLTWSGPEWVGTSVPTDANERVQLMFSALRGRDVGHFPQYHQPLAHMREEILQRAAPVTSLAKFNPGKADQIRAWLASHGHTETDTVFQGLKARSEDMTVMIDKKTGDVIGIAPFKPWE